MRDRRLAVIGAGWAGLAAAVQAVTLGWQVSVFEMARQAGGRARRSLHRPTTDGQPDGLTLDNGQHILIGAYRECLRLMRTVGVPVEAVLQRLPLALVFADGRGLALPRGPATPAFLAAVLRNRAWRWRDRLALLAAAAAWRRAGFRCDDRLSVADLCAHLPATVRADLIDPLCVAALNTPSDRASAAVWLRVLHDGLFAGPGASDLLLPRVDLGALWPEPAQRWLAQHGAALHLGHRVAALAPADAGWRVDDHAFDAVVLATSCHEATRLVRAHRPDWAHSSDMLQHQPIATVYACQPGRRLPRAMLALRSHQQAPAQFVFDLGQLRGGVAAQGWMAFVASAPQLPASDGVQALGEAVLAQARAQLGDDPTQPWSLRHTVVEKRATFACSPGLQRPPTQIAPRLCAAGDYVAGPYPATLEGAVRSGVAAVQQLSTAIAEGAAAAVPRH